MAERPAIRLGSSRLSLTAGKKTRFTPRKAPSQCPKIIMYQEHKSDLADLSGSGISVPFRGQQRIGRGIWHAVFLLFISHNNPF
jgi:hypothetical protein